MGSVLPWLRRRSALEILAVAMLCLLVIVASVAPLALHGAATTTDVANALKGPSSEHWLGTDDLGRDIAARVLVATRLSLALALGATAIGITTGLVLGAASSAPRVGGSSLRRSTSPSPSLVCCWLSSSPPSSARAAWVPWRRSGWP